MVFLPFLPSQLHQAVRIVRRNRSQEMECRARGCPMTTRSFDSSEIKIIRCPYCGNESRATSGWVRGHPAFQCGGCGEQVSLHETKIRKVFDAVRRRLGEITGG